MPAMLDDVRRHLRGAKTNPGIQLDSAPVRAVPLTWPGRMTCSTTGSATRCDRLPVSPDGCRAVAYSPSFVSSSRLLTLAKIRSWATRETCSHSAVAATQRSASCSFWPKPCPVLTHQARNVAYTSVRCGPGQTISARPTSYSSRRSRSGPQSASLAPYSSSATVTKEITAGRPSSIGRYSAASNRPLGASRAPNTPVSMTTGPRESRFMRS